MSCARAEARRRQRAARKVQAGRRLARSLGCQCMPDVAYALEAGRMTVHHDPSCPMVDAASSVLYRADDGRVYDLGAVVTFAVESGTTVIAAREAVIIVPDGATVAPTVIAACRATEVPEAVVYELRPEVVADLERQVRGWPA